MSEFREDLQRVNDSYIRRKGKERSIWEGFGKEVDGLTKEISKGFRLTLEALSLTTKRWDNKIFNVSVNKFEVKYNPTENDFDIEITNWFVDDDSQNWCAYSVLKDILFGVHEYPLIRQFRKEYFVRNINCDCHCGSDHK